MVEFDKLTPSEKDAIQELKKRIEHELTPPLLQDPTLYYRFLKARDFNIKNAEIMLRKHMSDRKLFGTDTILSDYKPPEHIQSYFPSSFVCYGKDGYIIRYIDLGSADQRGIVSMWSMRDMIVYNIYYLEQDFAGLAELNKKTGRTCSKLVMIINMDKMNLFNATFKKGIEALITGFKLYQDNYPERIQNIYVINTSIYATVCVSILKTCLASALLQKIKFYGRDGWKQGLLEIIDADVLPVFLGGNKTDPNGDPMCNSFIIHGKPIPEELIRTRTNKSISRELGVKKLIVTRFSSSEIVFYVYEPNTIIEWEFEIKSKDICFVLYYKDSCKENAKIEELIPKQRMDTLMGSETGVYKCDRTGTYIIAFDNSYSWIYSKEIYYRIRLIRPNENKSLTN